MALKRLVLGACVGHDIAVLDIGHFGGCELEKTDFGRMSSGHEWTDF